MNTKANKTSQHSGFDFVPLVQDEQSAVRLVCFHFAGGSAQSFLPWRQYCNGNFELLAAELPGRSRRFNEAFYTSITEAANDFADAYMRLKSKQTIFYGHSLGALLAYETTRALLKRGVYGPDRLIISSRSSPVSFPVSIGLPELSRSSLMKYLHDLQGTKKEILENKMLMDMMLPIMKADLEIIYGYQHDKTPMLTIPVDVIGAIGDSYCPFESLLDWRNVTRGEFSFRMIPGGHFAAISEPKTIFDTVKNLNLHIERKLVNAFS